MEKDLVFFKKEGEGGVALTSTSANHIANLAKEYILDLESRLSGISFLNVEASLIGTDTSNCIQIGTTKSTLDEIPMMLETVASAKSLIAWLREAIKAKDNIIKSIQNISIEEWCKENEIEFPVLCNNEHVLTEEEYYNSLPIKERNRYYQLETIAATIGQYIHPTRGLSVARKNLKDRIQCPHEVQGTGRDSLIYSFTPSVSSEDVDNTFYELQRTHREVQAQLNSIKNDCKIAIEESTSKANAELAVKIEEYRDKKKNLDNLFKTWVDKKTAEYSKLKIAIPNSLIGIYTTITSLGK